MTTTDAISPCALIAAAGLATACIPDTTPDLGIYGDAE
jgi:hypothetical protein